jgi:hypothetical protein
MGRRMPSFKEEEERLRHYKWVKGYGKNIIKYYPEHRRYACVHAQKRHGLIAAMCILCERLGEGEEGE